MEILHRNKKSSLQKPDLTAIADLGFLLITFLMLASSMAQPKTMQILQPDNDGSFSYPESLTAAIVLEVNEVIYTYSFPDGMLFTDSLKMDIMDYSTSGLRSFIQRRQSEVEILKGNRDKLFDIIKPMPGSSYKNMVDVLDEMLINNVKLCLIRGKEFLS